MINTPSFDKDSNDCALPKQGKVAVWLTIPRTIAGVFVAVCAANGVPIAYIGPFVTFWAVIEGLKFVWDTMRLHGAATWHSIRRTGREDDEPGSDSVEQ